MSLPKSSADALAEQETVQQPFEQPFLVALADLDAEIGGGNVATHDVTSFGA
ncbi:MAG: hypothetical protein ABI748_14210 [Dokdonella sp.]